MDKHQNVLKKYTFEIYEDWVSRGSSDEYIDFIDREKNRNLILKIKDELDHEMSYLQHKTFNLGLITLQFGRILDDNYGALQVKITKND